SDGIRHDFAQGRTCGGHQFTDDANGQRLVFAIQNELQNVPPDSMSEINVDRGCQPTPRSRRRKVSTSTLQESLSGETLELGLSIQRTGTSTIFQPRRRAIRRISTSKDQRSNVWRGKSSSAAREVNNLKPHWVSLMPGKAMACTSKLNARPIISR